MAKFGVKRELDQDCYSAGLARMRQIFDLHDHVAVSFSGGKDSTCCLHLALTVAEETNRLPLRVFTFDEEAIPPETVEYMARVVADHPDTIKFEWYCLPIQHRNACSNSEPYWYCWDETKKDRWCRDLPPLAITELKGFKDGGGIPDQVPILYPPSLGTCANIMGVRTQESITRYRTIAGKRGWKAYITVNGEAKHVNNCYPIYDWGVEDVWLAPLVHGWDYNRAYDVMDKCGMPLGRQRCAPPFGEQPIRGLYTFKECWPALWAKMVDRVPGAATAARYANTDLYGVMSPDESKPADMTWKAYTFFLLGQLEPAARAEVADGVSHLTSDHKGRASGPIPDDVADPVTGYSWRIICRLPMAGGNKFGRQSQKINNEAIANRKKAGITS